MATWQGRSLTKPSGGRIRPWRKKRKREIGGDFVPVRLGPKKVMKKRVRGGRMKLRLLSVEYANVSDSSGNTRKAKILRVIENPAGRDFTRTQTITRGAIIQTEIGKARVTGRPGQEPVVNAVLIE